MTKKGPGRPGPGPKGGQPQPPRVPKIWESIIHTFPPKSLHKREYLHMCCALLVTDITFGNPEQMSDLSLEQMGRARMDLKCVVCNHAGGGTMQCSVGNCYKGFHVCCARARNFSVGFRLTDGHPLGFCREHSGQRYRRVRETMLNGRKLMAAEVEDATAAEEEGKPVLEAPQVVAKSDAEKERDLQIKRNQEMMRKMFN